MVLLAAASPPLACVVWPVGLDVPVPLAWPGALASVVWVVATPRSSVQELVVWAQLARLALPEVLVASAGLGSPEVGLVPGAQMPPEQPRVGYAVPCCIFLVRESLGA